MIKKKSLLNYCGLLGVVAFLSYTAAVVFSPLAYPDYDWMAQAVSDLSASNAPSLRLWNQLSSLYNVCTLVCAMGMNIVPKAYFGIVERFSVFAATGYNAVLGIELYRMLHNTGMTYLKGLGVKDSTLWDLSGGDRSDESNSNG